MAEVEIPISLDGVLSIQIVGASACVIFILHQKIQKMANKDTIFQYANRRWGKPARTQHGPVPGCRVMLMIT